MGLPVYESAARPGAVVPEITNMHRKNNHKAEKNNQKYRISTVGLMAVGRAKKVRHFVWAG
jgi:hypothetical protein